MRSIWSAARISLPALMLSIVLAACGSNENDVDKRSYQKGYDAFGGAYVPPNDSDRETVEAQCDEMLRSRDMADPDFDLVREDWITGCADAAQGKESRI
jgi:hypothetical protein